MVQGTKQGLSHQPDTQLVHVLGSMYTLILQLMPGGCWAMLQPLYSQHVQYKTKIRQHMISIAGGLQEESGGGEEKGQAAEEQQASG